VGGGTFLIKKLGESSESRAGNLRRHRGIEPKHYSVAFRFQIPDFDFFLGSFGFFSLCHFQFLLSLVSFSYVEVFENCSGEEQPSFIPVRVGSGIF